MTPQNFLDKLTYGWNLGNYFDCYKGKIKMRQGGQRTVKDVTALWGNGDFNLKCFETLKDLGVSCIRIPITWCNFVVYKDGNYIVQEQVFKKLKIIINRALELDLVVIIDMHHDDKNWLMLSSSDAEFEEVKKEYEQIWQQVASAFSGYGENLIFEGMNEIIEIDEKGEHWYSENKASYKRLSELYEIFMRAVRNSGGHNGSRPLMVSTYGAQIYSAAIKGLALPKDDNLILDVHFYARGKGDEYFNKCFAPLKAFIQNRKLPVIIGECGVAEAFSQDEEIFNSYMNYLSVEKFKCLLWDNGVTNEYKFIDRKTARVSSDALKVMQELFS